ncbi:hypothetical protein [Anaeromassilibacillus sp. SJQ-5]|jgi:hypothetical protein
MLKFDCYVSDKSIPIKLGKQKRALREKKTGNIVAVMLPSLPARLKKCFKTLGSTEWRTNSCRFLQGKRS